MTSPIGAWTEVKGGDLCSSLIQCTTFKEKQLIQMKVNVHLDSNKLHKGNWKSELIKKTAFWLSVVSLLRHELVLLYVEAAKLKAKGTLHLLTGITSGKNNAEFTFQTQLEDTLN